MNCQTAIQLLQNNSAEFYLRFEEIIFKVVDRFCQQPIGRTLEQAPLFREVKRRLPNRLAKICKKAPNKVYFLTLFAKSIQVICEDVLDATLMQQKSPQLLIRYQEFIKLRVISLIQSQYFRAEDEEDIRQIVCQKILEKIRSGKLLDYRSDDNALFSTYFKRVINNLLIDIHRVLYESQKRQKADELKPELVENQSGMSNQLFGSISNSLDREEQVKQLNVLLQMLPPKTLTKFQTCLKSHYYLIFLSKDVETLQLNRRQGRKFLSFFGVSYQDVNAKEVWGKLNPFICIFEGKKTSPVNLRKWFTRYRNKIVSRIMSDSLAEYNNNMDDREFAALLLQKISSDRMVGKAAYQWFGEIVVVYFEGR